jgi:hypothetical protein
MGAVLIGKNECDDEDGVQEQRFRGSTSAIRRRITSASARSSATRSRTTRPVTEAERWLAPVLNYDPPALAREAAE